VVVSGLAGCSGGDSTGGGRDGGDGGSDPTETETLTPIAEDLGDPDGSVGENSIDEQVVMELESFGADDHEEAPEDRFTVEVTLGNNGEQETDLSDYTYSLEITSNEGDVVDLRIETANLIRIAVSHYRSDRAQSWVVPETVTAHSG
jgi:hypothetical protein